MSDTRIRLTIGESEFVITVDDGVAEIRGHHQRASERHRHMETTIEVGGADLPISLAVRAEPA